jgi:hypothetical protein
MLGSRKSEKTRQVKSMLIILSLIKGIAHKEFALEDQAVNSAYY